MMGFFPGGPAGRGTLLPFRPAFFPRVAAAALLWLVAPVSCREIQPSLPDGYVGSRPPLEGWPPPAAYDADPLHPANRWFQRAFAPRDARGEIAPVCTSEPLPVAPEPSGVDLAELAALLDAVQGEPPSPEGPAIVRAVFASDALAVGARILAPSRRGSVPPELARSLAGATVLPRSPGAGWEDLWAGAVVPPPLRDGCWGEVVLPASESFRPSPADPRWARALRERSRTSPPDERPSRIVLLRLRTALARDGSPLLLPLASECLEVGEDAAGVPPRAWRFDRKAAAQGADPWIQVEAGLVSMSFPESLLVLVRSRAGEARDDAQRPADMGPASVQITPEARAAWEQALGAAVQGVLSALQASRSESPADPVSPR